MKQDVRFRRNVYVILLGVLLLAILIQVARSEFVLQSNYNEQWSVERDKLLNEEWPQAQAVNYDQTACIAYSEKEPISIRIKDNAEQTLKYMKFPVLSINLDEKQLNYEKCPYVLFATGQLELAGDSDKLEQYVANGGSVFFMKNLEISQYYYRLYRKFGVISFDYAYSTNGIHLTSNVLIGQKGLRTGEEFINNTAISVELDERSRLMAESLEGVPLLWNRQYGDGSFTVFNGEMLEYKSNRGLIAGAVSLMKPNGFYPLFNAKLFYIDDFPSPVEKGIRDKVYDEYRMEMPEFYRKIWWPDMLKAARNYNVKYTAAIIQSYNDSVTPPFRDPVDQERHNLIAYGREVIKSGGEISIHGYNHQSLITDKSIADYYEYHPWTSQAYMEEAVEEVVRYLGTAFPSYTAMSYVPPSNALSEAGREALKAGWPDLTVIASLYDTDYYNRSYIQEFEVAEDGIIEMPRVTSGYFEEPYMQWLEVNAITSIGVFSHFIHPDDLLDKERSNNQNWDDLFKDFTELLGRLNQTYPWLRDMTSTEAGLSVAQALRSNVKIEREPNRIAGTVQSFSGELYYVLRTDRSIGRLEHCKIRKIDEQTYLVEIQKAQFAIELGG
ncbi:DUF2194 domain-containing protein [Paenibacillus sp. PL2-23]|uniref:DUF2194 domain-containing protein n=1 Tax=Paenibacillus sp. PL2-23 TaxID=2100729 RepID=UPI0030F6D279